MNVITKNRTYLGLFSCFLHCFRYLAGDGDDMDAVDLDENEDNDEDDPEETDDEESAFDTNQFCTQVLKIQQNAVARFSALPHRQTKLLTRLEKTTT